MLANVAAAASQAMKRDHPLLAVREEKRIQLVLVTAIRVLAGAFNANLLRIAQRFIDEQQRQRDCRWKLSAAKAAITFAAQSYKLSGEHVGIVDKPSYENAREIADKLIDRYTKAEIDAVYLCRERVQKRDVAEPGAASGSAGGAA